MTRSYRFQNVATKEGVFVVSLLTSHFHDFYAYDLRRIVCFEVIKSRHSTYTCYISTDELSPYSRELSKIIDIPKKFQFSTWCLFTDTQDDRSLGADVDTKVMYSSSHACFIGGCMTSTTAVCLLVFQTSDCSFYLSFCQILRIFFHVTRVSLPLPQSQLISFVVQCMHLVMNSKISYMRDNMWQ